ncbi:hypothetical protein RQP46_002038 [Phenoliferia psychrophenolica]
MGRPLPAVFLDGEPSLLQTKQTEAAEPGPIPLPPFATSNSSTPLPPRAAGNQAQAALSDWLANAPPRRPPGLSMSEYEQTHGHDWRRHAFLADRAIEIGRRLSDVRAAGQAAVLLGPSDQPDSPTRSRIDTAASALPQLRRRLSSPQFERAGERLIAQPQPDDADAPLPLPLPPLRAPSALPSVRLNSATVSPPSPRPRHRTTSPPTPSSPLTSAHQPPATPRESTIPLPPLFPAPPSTREQPTYNFSLPSLSSTSEPFVPPFSPAVSPPPPRPTSSQSASEALQLSSRIDRLVSFRERIAASTAAGRPAERDAILRNARNALQTAVSFAERLELATRELTRVSDLGAPTGGANSSFPTDPLRLPASTLSLQRSIDQLRAASARIDRVLDQHLAPSALERLHASRASPPSPSQGMMGLSAGLLPSPHRRRSSATQTQVHAHANIAAGGEQDDLQRAEGQEEVEVPRRRMRTMGYKLDRNGDPLEEDDEERAKSSSRRTRELIGR